MNKNQNKSQPRRLPFLFWVGMFLMFFGGVGWVLLQVQKSGPMQVMQLGLGDSIYQVEVAQTEPQRSKGLMFRERLDADKGMLFVFDDEQEQTIWMKNTLIPLDILFFRKDGSLLSWKDQAPPCKTQACPVYPSGGRALYVLELAAGQRKTLDLKVGEKMRLIEPKR